MFQGSGAVFTTHGFEYWANPDNRDEGFITWQVDGKPTVRMGASAMGVFINTNGDPVRGTLEYEEYPVSICE